MGPIELSLLLIVVGWLYTRYRAITLELALERRSKMIEPLREILHDPEASNDLKLLAMSVFHYSLSRGIISGLLASIFIKNKRTAELLERLTKDEHKRYSKLILKHFLPVNAYATPLSYSLIMLIIVALLIPLVFIGGIARLVSVWNSNLRTAIESALARPIERQLRHNH